MTEREFISSWVSKLASDGIKNFPADFIPLNRNSKEIRLPGKTLLIGEEFFGKYEILTADGSSVLHTDNYIQAKSLIYSNRTTPEIILLPSDEADLKKAIQSYESYLDSLLKKLKLIIKISSPEKTIQNRLLTKSLNS